MNQHMMNRAEVKALGVALCVRELNLKSLELVLRRCPTSIKGMEELDRVSPLILVATRKDNRSNADVICLLLRHGADPNHKLFGDGPPPLFFTLVGEFSVEVTRALVEGGARINPQEQNGFFDVAFHTNADIEVIKLLVSAGADLFKAGIDTLCPLIAALNFPKYLNVSAFRSLLNIQDGDITRARNSSRGTILHSALNNGCTADFVNLLLDRGIGVNSLDNDSDSPLHMAVRNWTCGSDVVDLLLRKGALVNVRNSFGNTPLTLAVLKNRKSDIIQMLLKYCLLQNSNSDVEHLICRRELGVMYVKYSKDCENELERMNSENVGKGRTLFQFLQTYSSGNQMSKNVEEGYNVDRLLQILADELYPQYADVISSKLGRSVLRDKLKECSVCTVVRSSIDERCPSKTVFLLNDCVRVLTNYLDDNDLLNMIIASYYNPISTRVKADTKLNVRQSRSMFRSIVRLRSMLASLFNW